MADPSREMLNLLQMIERNTGRTASTIDSGRRQGNFSGDDKNDKFAKSSDDLTKQFKNLETSVKDLKKAEVEATKILNRQFKIHQNQIDKMGQVTKSLNDQQKAGNLFGQALKNIAPQLDALRAANIDVDAAIQNSNRSYDELLSNLQEQIDASGDLTKATLDQRDAIRNQIKAQEAGMAKIQKRQEEMVTKGKESLVKGFAAAFGTIIQQFSDIALTTMQNSFELGGMSNVTGLLGSSAMMGVSPQEAQKFAAQNRDVLTAVTKNAMITADVAVGAAEDYGNIVRDTFGATGQAQLDMISKGMTALSSMGTEITPNTFKDFVQGVENMAKTSNMTADEIFAEFSQLSEMEGMQGLMASLGQGANAGLLLTEQFLACICVAHRISHIVYSSHIMIKQCSPCEDRRVLL